MAASDRIKAFTKFAWVATRRAISLGGDVVFATSTPLTIALPGIVASRRLRVPLVFEVRDLWPEVPIALGVLRNPLIVAVARLMERLAYHNAREIVALSPDMRAGILATGATSTKVTVIPNMCEIDRFSVEAEPTLRRSLKWLGERRLILYAGTVGRVNDVGYLVKVAHAMKAISSEVRFIVIGDGNDLERTRSLAGELGVLDHSMFFLPAVPKAEIAAWFRAADLCTSTVDNVPALWANSANKFFDSLAAGRPIAINYGGWQARLIREHDVGLVLDPNDPSQAAIQIAEKLRDPDWLSASGQRARSLACSEYSSDILGTRLEQVLIRATTPPPLSTIEHVVPFGL